jgi:hypothetical protein
MSLPTWHPTYRRRLLRRHRTLRVETIFHRSPLDVQRYGLVARAPSSTDLSPEAGGCITGPGSSGCCATRGIRQRQDRITMRRVSWVLEIAGNAQNGDARVPPKGYITA